MDDPTDPDPTGPDPGALGPGSTRPLLVAIDEVDRAERRLRLRVRTALGLNNTDFSALVYVDRRERRGAAVRVGELSEYFAISTAAATTIVNRLSVAGYLERRPDPGDGRGRTLRTTPVSRDRLEGEVGVVRSGLDDLINDLGDADEQRMLELLRRIRDVLSPDLPRR